MQRVLPVALLFFTNIHFRVSLHGTGITAAKDVASDDSTVLDVHLCPDAGRKSIPRSVIATAGTIYLTAIYLIVVIRITLRHRQWYTYCAPDVDGTLGLPALC